MMPNIAVQGDQLQGNIIQGSILLCQNTEVNADGTVTAAVGDTVIATGVVGTSIQTHTGTILTGSSSVTINGKPAAIIGISTWQAGPFAGNILGPGSASVMTTD